MVKLRTPKVSGALRQLTNLRPVLRCKTRWSGACNMVERYFELKEYLRSLILNGDDPFQLEDLDLRPTAVGTLKSLFANMQKLNSVMLELQKPDLDLSTVRLLFDHTINSFPTMRSFIGVDANIIHSPAFENAVVKLLRKVLPIFYCSLIIYLVLTCLFTLQTSLTDEDEEALYSMKVEVQVILF